MKKFLIAALAAAGVVVYLLSKKRTPMPTSKVEQTHHLTKVFSRAKQHAVHH